ncbi:TIGR01621 family pseudouridine synthase [Marinomonas epiphytica]
MLSVVYRCEDYWIINKPHGMSFHNESELPGVMQVLASQYPEHKFYPVHRLDKMTSGLLVVACHAKAAAQFGSMFEDKRVEKRYLALSKRKPRKKQGTIAGGMQPSRRGQWKLTQDSKNYATTQFFSSFYQGVRVFYVRPISGKTHQIRVALKSIGAPILGDSRYAVEQADRGYLHAMTLSFDWQGNKKSYSYMPCEGEYFTAELWEFVMQQFDEEALQWPSVKTG